MKTARLSALRVDERLKAELEKMAEERHRSLAEIRRQALEKELASWRRMKYYWGVKGDDEIDDILAHAKLFPEEYNDESR